MIFSSYSSFINSGSAVGHNLAVNYSRLATLNLGDSFSQHALQVRRLLDLGRENVSASGRLGDAGVIRYRVE